jgi:uncharacterized membrane protein/alkylhydroperoxidase family enzyme
MQNVVTILGLILVPFWLLQFAGVRRETRACIGLALVLTFTGAGHFLKTGEMAQMLPTWVPNREFLIYATGALEWAAAAALAVRRTRRPTGIFLCLFFIAIFPANVFAALHRVEFGGHSAGPLYLLVRFPLQLFLIVWAYWFAVRQPTRSLEPKSLHRLPRWARLVAPLYELGIRSQERRLGMPLDYLRSVGKEAPSFALKLSLLSPLGNHRRSLPPEVFHVARLQATLAEDCGACAQMAANLAKQDGVSPQVLRAVAQGDVYRFPLALAQVCQFVDAVLMDRPEQTDLRNLMRDRYGEEGLIELSAAIALASFFPRFKRGLGVAQSCALQPVFV